MYESVKAIKMGNLPTADPVERSFSQIFKKEELAKWDQEMRSQLGSRGKYESYSVFAPLRSLLGRTVLKRTFTEKEIERMLPRIFRVLKIDFEKRVASAIEDGTRVDLRAMNVELFSSLRKVIVESDPSRH